MSEGGSAVIAVPDCVIVVYDQASPVAGEALAPELMRYARGKAGGDRAAYFGAWMDVLQPFFEVGALAVWLSLLDGVYKIRANIHETLREVKATLNDEFVSKQRQRVVTLNCPTGQIMVGSMQALLSGRSQRLVMLPPGRYLVGLEHDVDQEGMHGMLAGIDEYPMADGPDWTIHVCSLSSSS